MKIIGRLLSISAALILTTNISDAEDLGSVSVFGSQDETQQAGSAHFIGDDEIKKWNYTDPERILSRIPGVYSQTEDGYGLRTNLGMRGVNPLRTSKINTMEDGVLQGPAQYSNFSMYFYPDTGRMEGVEVLKGPAAVGTGPKTTAGTVNWISRTVPTQGTKGHYSFTLGDDGFSRNHAYYGAQLSPSISYVFEVHDYRADGFKSIKGTSNPGDTGFDKTSDLFKIRYTPVGSKWNQYFELSSQNTEETSNETYIGLTTAAFHSDPFQRYGASAADQMDADYHRYIFTHYMEPSSTSRLTTKLYKTRFSRLWAKMGKVYVDPQGNGSGSVSSVSLSALDMQGACAADAGNELRACNIITGTTATAANEYLEMAMGHRDYGMTGIQFVYNKQMGNHDIEIGYRRHKDYRLREDSGFIRKYGLDSNNTLSFKSETGATDGAGELKDTDAESWHIKDIITHGNFTTTLGLRYEDTESNDGTEANPGNSKQDVNDDETMLSAATVYQIQGGAQIFAGYHQGYSPIGAGTSADATPEESDNYEVGLRMSSPDSFIELIAFYVDYENLLESCLIANGCTGNIGDSNNAGKAEIKGIEFQYRLADIFAAPAMKGQSTMKSIKYPLLVSGILQDSEYLTNTDDELNQLGKSIAYVPDFQMYVSLGAETPNWAVTLGAKYHDDTFTNPSNTYRTGKAWLFDLHSSMNLPIKVAGVRNARGFINIDNLFDKTIVASEHNYGKRPNKPQTFMAGVKLDF